jgi:hypothetical protein
MPGVTGAGPVGLAPEGGVLKTGGLVAPGPLRWILGIEIEGTPAVDAALWPVELSPRPKSAPRPAPAPTSIARMIGITLGRCPPNVMVGDMPRRRDGSRRDTSRDPTIAAPASPSATHESAEGPEDGLWFET